MVDPECGITKKYAHTTLVCTDSDKQEVLKQVVEESDLCHLFSSREFYAQKVENFGSPIALENLSDEEIKYIKSISDHVDNIPVLPEDEIECRKIEFTYTQAKSLRDYLFDQVKKPDLAKKIQTNNWVVVLSFGDEEVDMRAKLSNAFDKFMCPENNGVLYQWQLSGTSRQDAQLKQPHITIGPRDEDKLLAEGLIDKKTTIKFSQIDYKPIGRHDSVFTLKFAETEELAFLRT